MEQLFEIAGHFEAIAAAIAALRVAYGDDPAAIASLVTAEDRIERAATLLKTQIIESDAYDALPPSADNDNERQRTDTNGVERRTSRSFVEDPVSE